MNFKNNSVQRMVYDALLTAIALSIFIVELQLPALTPIPGIKLGLANIITVVALFTVGIQDAFAIMLVRILAGCMATGQMMAIFYSLAGGCLSFAIMVLLHKVLTEKQIFVASVFGALFHNVGQILMAILLTETVAVVWYLPVLGISGIITGLFTGVAAQYTVNRLKRIKRN